PDPDGNVAHLADDNVLHGLDQLELVVREHVVVDVANLDVARRHEEVRVIDRANHVQDRDALRVQEIAVEVNRDLPDLAPVHVGGRHPVDPLDLRVHRVVRDVVELTLVEAASRHGQEANRNVGKIGTYDE